MWEDYVQICKSITTVWMNLLDRDLVPNNPGYSLKKLQRQFDSCGITLSIDWLAVSVGQSSVFRYISLAIFPPSTKVLLGQNTLKMYLDTVSSPTLLAVFSSTDWHELMFLLIFTITQTKNMNKYIRFLWFLGSGVWVWLIPSCHKSIITVKNYVGVSKGVSGSPLSGQSKWLCVNKPAINAGPFR